MTTAHERVIRRRASGDQDRSPLVTYLCLFGALLVIVNCYVFLICSSFIRNESVLYSLHASSTGLNISTGPRGACDFSKGEWVFDKEPPLYTNDTCSYIQGHQNCMSNGRPDREFLNWRWKPDNCELPRFNPHAFLNLVRDKKMMFFGDSIARNHMQSLLCAIAQVEKPEIVYRHPIDKDVIWRFPGFNFTLAIFWSPFLVKHEQKEENGTTLMHIHLDSPEEIWKNGLSGYDLVVMSSGPWFFKGSVYYMNNEVIGCHHCPKEMNLSQVVFMDAYRTVLGNVFKFISSHGGYRGSTFFRTFSVEHFEGGEWWNGGACNRTRPFQNSSLELPWTSSEMHRIQVEEVEKAESRASENGSKTLKLLDVTYSAFLRPDGHPGIYRSQKRDPKQQGPLQSDCLHWCLPGPIDTWNEILFQKMN